MSEPEQAIQKDKRMLSRLKLSLWTATVLLVIHALPGRLIQEMYPVTRWAMFSEPQVYPLERTFEFELDITDNTGEIYKTTGSSLYAGLVGNFYELSASIINRALENEDADRQAEYRQALIERIADFYDIEVSKVEIWGVTYTVDLSRLPHTDYANPLRRDLWGQFTADDVPPHSTLQRIGGQ